MKPKVLFIYTINPGVTYYRMYCFAKKMDELGLVHSRLYPNWDPKRLFAPNWEQNFKKEAGNYIPHIKWADMVVCQYIGSPEGLSLIMGTKDFKPVLMECDDYFQQVPHQSIAFDHNKPTDMSNHWASRQVMTSTGIITTTEYLQDHFRKLNPMVKVIPNCIDFDLWDKYKPVPHNKIRIGWIGGATHAGDLKLVKEVCYKILDKYENVEINIVSSPHPDWQSRDRLNLIDQWVTIDNYPAHVKRLSFDIGIVPLRDNLFNRGKSNLRYLEYSTCHIPTVASHVEPFKKNFFGYTVNSSEEWFNALSLLIENEPLRKEIGERAYNFVKEHFNLNDIARKYSGIINEVIYGSEPVSLPCNF